MSGFSTLWQGIKRHGLTVVVVVLSAYVLSRLADPGEVVRTFSTVDPVPYVGAVAFFYVTFPIRAIRWRILLRGVDVDADIRSGSIIILLNWFLNTLLPAKAGDLHRSYLASENYGTTKATALGTIAAERVIDLAVLAFGLIVAVLMVLQSFTSFELRVLALAAGFLVAVGSGVLVIVLLNPAFLPDAVTEILENFRAGLTAMQSASEVGVVVAITVGMWTLNVVRMSLVARSVGFEIALPVLVLVALLIAFLSGLPYTPAGVGVVEVVTTSVLIASTDIPESAGLSFILFDRLITVGSLVAVGALAYIYLKLTTDLRLLARTDEEAEGGSEAVPGLDSETDD